MATWKRNVVFVYGGTFDPIHEGHLNVIQTAVNTGKQIVVAPAQRNPWKSVEPLPLYHRQKMIELAVQAAGMTISRYYRKAQVMLDEVEYVYTADFVRHWTDTYSTKIIWIIGTDGLDSVIKWKDFPELDIALYPWFITHNWHSTDVREGRVPPLPAIREHISRYNLYPNSNWNE